MHKALICECHTILINTLQEIESPLKLIFANKVFFLQKNVNDSNVKVRTTVSQRSAATNHCFHPTTIDKDINDLRLKTKIQIWNFRVGTTSKSERPENEGRLWLRLSWKNIVGKERPATEPRRYPSTQKPLHPSGARESNAPAKRWGCFSSARGVGGGGESDYARAPSPICSSS